MKCTDTRMRHLIEPLGIIHDVLAGKCLIFIIKVVTTSLDATQRWHPWTISQGSYSTRGSLVDRSLSASLHIVSYRDTFIGISWSRCLTVVISLSMEASHTIRSTFPLSLFVDSNFLISYRNLIDWRANHDLSIYESHHWYWHSPFYCHPLSSHSMVHPKPLLDYCHLSLDGLLPTQSAIFYISAHIISWSYINPPIMPSNTNFIIISYRDLIIDSRLESQPTYPTQLCQFHHWYQSSRLVPSVPSSRLISVSSSPPCFSSLLCLL